ncbi:unnamed protein product, partial [Coregonus sp. 'balchen']
MQLLQDYLNERLTAVAVEIFGAVENTIAEYQEEISRSKEEIDRLRKLLDLVFQPDIMLHRAVNSDCSAAHIGNSESDNGVDSGGLIEDVTQERNHIADFVVNASLLLQVFLNERLTAATVEIFGAVENTIAEYQEEISRSKEEIERLRRLLDLAFKPDIKLHIAENSDCSAAHIGNSESDNGVDSGGL